MRALWPLLAVLLLAGCGGGSGNSTIIETDSPPVVNEPEPEPEPEPPEDPEPVPPVEPEPDSLPAPVHIGECSDVDAEAELVRRVAAVMALPDEAIRQTWIYCDPWTPGPDRRTFQEQGLRAIQCYADTWPYLIGCINGVSLNRANPGVVALIRLSPDTMDVLLEMARQQGLDTGPMPQEQLRCLWSLHRLMLVLVHEWHHAWFGLHHRDPVAAEVMAAEDRRVQPLVMQEHGEWIRAANWPDCPMPRDWIIEPPISERITL